MTSTASRRFFPGGAAALALIALAACPTFAQDASKDAGAWTPLFNGTSLDGWEKVGNPESVWEVKDGAIQGSGPASMLVCTQGP